jgi:hypothetical protein
VTGHAEPKGSVTTLGSRTVLPHRLGRCGHPRGRASAAVQPARPPHARARGHGQVCAPRAVGKRFVVPAGLCQCRFRMGYIGLNHSPPAVETSPSLVKGRGGYPMGLGLSRVEARTAGWRRAIRRLQSRERPRGLCESRETPPSFQPRRIASCLFGAAWRPEPRWCATLPEAPSPTRPRCPPP